VPGDVPGFFISNHIVVLPILGILAGMFRSAGVARLRTLRQWLSLRETAR
jgi:hypothetical protein